MIHFPRQESCGELLLEVLAQTGGDAVVMYAGDMPYLVGQSGEHALAHSALTRDAVMQVARELLPTKGLERLNQTGVYEHDCLTPRAPGAAFKVVAGKADNDLWVEIRRMRAVAEIELPATEQHWLKLAS